jgi:hypothetical protein
MTNQHVAIYHIHSKADYNLFLSSFKQLKLNFGEFIYDLNMSDTNKQLSFEIPETLSTKRYQNDQKEQKPKTDTNRQAQSQSSSGNNTVLIATGRTVSVTSY